MKYIAQNYVHVNKYQGHWNNIENKNKVQSVANVSAEQRKCQLVN